MIHKKIEIWNIQIKDDNDSNNKNNYKVNNENLDFKPTLTTYILDGKRPAVLVLPGGGYSMTSPREAEPIALQFNEAGYHAFVLDYSVAPQKHPQPLLDAARAMCIIRENAVEWDIYLDKIAICGFSAGAHLAASLAVHWDKEYVYKVCGIEIGKIRPDALIACYPVITSGEYAHKGSIVNLLGENPTKELLDEMSLEKQVNAKTPPAFIWHTFSDKGVPVENSLLFASAFRKNKVPFELHIYPEGVHGLSLASEETADGRAEYVLPHVASWMKLCKEWLKLQFNQK